MPKRNGGRLRKYVKASFTKSFVLIMNPLYRKKRLVTRNNTPTIVINLDVTVGTAVNLQVPVLQAAVRLTNKAIASSVVARR